ADEMEADWQRITLVQADADTLRFGIPFPYPIPGAPPLISSEYAQSTILSRSMTLYFEPMRQLGAALRLIMIRAAARKWTVDESELQAHQQIVRHTRSGRSAAYHRLLLDATQVAVPTTDEVSATLKTSDEWRWI